MRNVMMMIFALALVVAMTSIGSAQGFGAAGSAQGDYLLTVATTIDVAVGTGEVDFGSMPAGTYTYDPISLVLTPAPDGVPGTQYGPMDFAIATGQPTTVEITFTLPSYFVGQTSFGHLPISFGPKSAYVTDGGTIGSLFDPNAPYSVACPGALTVQLGGTFTIPAGAADDVYAATVVCTAAVTGL